MGYPRFRQRGSGRALKVNAVTAANQKSLTTIQQEVMRSAGFIHQPDTLVPSQGRSPDGDTHALHRFIVPLIVKVVVSKNLYSCFDRLSDIVLYLT